VYERAGDSLMRFLKVSVVVAGALATAACNQAPERSVSAAAAPPSTGAAAAPGGIAAGMEHGDHNPHHGGVVYMYDDMHYEVVLDPGGHHRVYFSDSTREDLPASAAASVTLTVERPAGPPETVTGVIDQQGESWLLDGATVTEKDTNVRVAFVAHGTPYWIDVPFIAASTQ
jgi:hypothetical protein